MSIHTGDDVVNTVSWLLEFRQGWKRLCRHFKCPLSVDGRRNGVHYQNKQERKISPFALIREEEM